MALSYVNVKLIYRLDSKLWSQIQKTSNNWSIVTNHNKDQDRRASHETFTT